MDLEKYLNAKESNSQSDFAKSVGKVGVSVAIGKFFVYYIHTYLLFKFLGIFEFTVAAAGIIAKTEIRGFSFIEFYSQMSKTLCYVSYVVLLVHI